MRSQASGGCLDSANEQSRCSIEPSWSARLRRCRSWNPTTTTIPPEYVGHVLFWPIADKIILQTVTAEAPSRAQSEFLHHPATVSQSPTVRVVLSPPLSVSLALVLVLAVSPHLTAATIMAAIPNRARSVSQAQELVRLHLTEAVSRLVSTTLR